MNKNKIKNKIKNNFNLMVYNGYVFYFFVGGIYYDLWMKKKGKARL